MKALQRWLIGGLVLLLLGGSGTAVLAQSPEPGSTAPVTATSPVTVTGTLLCLPPAEGDPEGVTTHTWEASDPRLSGSVTYTGEWQIYSQQGAEHANCACSALNQDPSGKPATYRIENDGGSWLCTTARTQPPQQGEATTVTTATFMGEGGYEGLSAILLIDWATTPFTIAGLIIEGDIPAYTPPEA